jgi:hypothetical protein
MSFEFNPEQSQQNIKILKDLEEQKRRIRQTTTTTTSSTSSTLTVTQSNLLDNTLQQPTVAVKPLQTNISYCNTNTFGYFINTDSTYGNTIIPILPRL